MLELCAPVGHAARRRVQMRRDLARVHRLLEERRADVHGRHAVRVRARRRARLRLWRERRVCRQRDAEARRRRALAVLWRAGLLLLLLVWLVRAAALLVVGLREVREHGVSWRGGERWARCREVLLLLSALGKGGHQGHPKARCHCRQLGGRHAAMMVFVRALIVLFLFPLLLQLVLAVFARAAI